jgi:hypothetical protein
MFRKGLVGLVVLAMCCLLLYSFLRSSEVSQPSSENQFAGPKAAIVDQLGLYHPNQNFILNSMAILREAGFDVDYYGGGMVTVDLYRRLPTHGYDLIILRVHSGLMFEDNVVTRWLNLFTSERYSTSKYVLEQLGDQLAPAWPALEPGEYGEAYFAITPEFVRSGMEGGFEDALIIHMGCDGLVYAEMAEALVGRGASAFISWDALVGADHSDRATLRLLRGLVAEGQTIKRAVWETMKEVGPDPIDNSVLLWYPPEAGSYAVRVE